MSNPLDKYSEPNEYVAPVLTSRLAQYILKALDYLHIYAREHDEPEIIEGDLHIEAEGMMTDVILDAPEEDEDGEVDIS